MLASHSIYLSADYTEHTGINQEFKPGFWKEAVPLKKPS